MTEEITVRLSVEEAEAVLAVRRGDRALIRAQDRLRSALASQPEHSEEAARPTDCPSCGAPDGYPPAGPCSDPYHPAPSPEPGIDGEVAERLKKRADFWDGGRFGRENPQLLCADMRYAADRLLARPVLSEEIKSLWVEIGPEQIEAIRTELLKREADPADNAAPKREICKCALVTAKEGQRLREIAGYIEDKGEWPSDAAFLRNLAAKSDQENRGEGS